jgi:hypothetical protein
MSDLKKDLTRNTLSNYCVYRVWFWHIPTGNLVEDIDITINSTESLLVNEIVTISTEETTDMLMGFFLQSFCYNSKR